MYAYGGTVRFRGAAPYGTNYWVDVVFTPSTGTASLVSLAVTPASPSMGVGATQQLKATGTYSDNSTADLTNQVSWASGSLSVATITSGGLATGNTAGSSLITATLNGISGTATLTVTSAPLVSLAVTPASPSMGVGATQQFKATGTYSDNSTADLTSQVSWSSGSLSVATITSGGLATGNTAGSSLITATLNGIGGTATLAVTSVPPPSNTYTLFSSTAVPAMGNVNAGSPIELGMKFTADWTGAISAIRFYKGTSNSGTHVGNLWSSTGQLLATATFTNETASGWQQVSLATPVAITANTVYVVSYHTTGGYSANYGYFNTAVDNAPLHAVVNSDSNGNGVYGFGASSGFPGSGAAGTNYWVDVVFAPSTGTASLVSLAVTPASPSMGVGATQQFKATGTYSDNSTADLTNQVSWASGSLSVATITSGGLATGNTAGSSLITATLNGISGTATLTVTSAPLVSLAVTPASPSIRGGSDAAV